MTTLVSTPTTVMVVAAGNSALATLASTMSSGQWAQMSPAPSGLLLFSNQSGSGSGYVVDYLTKIAYDAAGRKIHCIGGTHGGVLQHLVYDEATNAWTSVGTPSFFQAPGYHGYEHTTFDSARGLVVSRPYGANGFCTWNGSSWSSLVNAGTVLQNSSNAVANATEYFPDRNSVIMFQRENDTYGKVAEYTTSRGWVALTGATLPNVGGYHNFARYSKVRQLIYMGGGNGSNSLFTLDAAGTLTQRANIPSSITANGPLGPGSPGSATPFVSPVNGNLIALAGVNNWQEYNPSTNAWTAKSGSAQILAANTADGSGYGICAVTLWNYGVVVFLKNYQRGSPAEMWLWKP